MTKEGLDLSTIRALLRYATTINRLAELSCSSEAADRDRIPCPADKDGNMDKCLCDGHIPHGSADFAHQDIPRIRLQDHQAEQRAIKAVPSDWLVVTQGDPRGYTLRVIPPSYADRNKDRDIHNLDAIGVPPGPSGLRF
jgi:hypothetical protein